MMEDGDKIIFKSRTETFVLDQKQRNRDASLFLIIIILSVKVIFTLKVFIVENHGKNSPLFLRGIHPEQVLQWNSQTSFRK